jgi:hypothetical protein
MPTCLLGLERHAQRAELPSTASALLRRADNLFAAVLLCSCTPAGYAAEKEMPLFTVCQAGSMQRTSWLADEIDQCRAPRGTTQDSSTGWEGGVQATTPLLASGLKMRHR